MKESDQLLKGVTEERDEAIRIKTQLSDMLRTMQPEGNDSKQLQNRLQEKQVELNELKRTLVIIIYIADKHILFNHHIIFVEFYT